ncbi:MAG: NUDIX hydrolase [Rhodoferax sp.]|nr:NUDIX hydrolase [Rhodoferax sp.]
MKYPLVDFPKPLTTVDVVIFTVQEGQLQVLLVRRPDATTEPFPNAWALPGGFVDIDKDASLEACARRKLLEKTGVKTPYLEQLGSWGNSTRDPRGWAATHAWFALLAPLALSLNSDATSQAAQWHAIDERSPRKKLAFDHREILQAAVKRLTSKVEYTSLPAFLLPEPFTLPQLQKAYEAVLRRPLDKSGFRTRALAANFLDETGFMDVGAPRQAMGYQIRDRNQVVYFPRTFGARSEGT